MLKLLLLIISAVLVNNFVLARFLGICPFLGVSKKIETSIGMGMAVINDRVRVSYIEFRQINTNDLRLCWTSLRQRNAELTFATNDKSLHGYVSASFRNGAAASLVESNGSDPAASGQSMPISGSSQRIDRSCSGA